MWFPLRNILILSLGLVPAAVSAQTVTRIPVTEVQTGTGGAQGSYAQSAQSELVLMVQQLQQEVRQLRGELENQQYRLQKMEREQRDRYRDVDRRISALINAGAGDAALAPPAAAVEPAVAEVAPAPLAAPAAATPSTPASGDDQSAYQQAFAFVRARQFDEGLQAFQAFIRDYPNSGNVANAWYWIGEIHLAQQNPEAARAAFEKVVNDYPRHNKVADALYKLGVVNHRLGNTRASAVAFQRVINEYPQSSAAGLARNFNAR